MKRMLSCFLIGIGGALAAHAVEPASISTAQADMAGEVTQTSIILQSRLTAANRFEKGDLPGAEGVARFEIALKPDFKTFAPTPWLTARPDHDCIVKTRVTQLRPNTLYYYRLTYGTDTNSTHTGPTSQFKTLPPENSVKDVSFVVGQSMNYAFFHYGSDGRGRNAYRGPDKGQGYPALENILYLNPDFMVFAGNAVYYDYPSDTRAKTHAQMRVKWHEQFVQPRLIKLLAQIPVYWEKNDHDYRFDDGDTSGDRAPSAAAGSRTFLEQVPLADAAETNSLTYRTQRINQHLQIWLLEPRDYRSTNSLPDGPGKSLWGMEQYEWLKHTLTVSDATYKIVISPTPMIDPDDSRKQDNHTNPQGFKYEGDTFFTWLRKEKFATNQVFFVAGDRHWQYHTVDSSGFEEFGCGNLVEANPKPVKRPALSDNENGVKRLFIQKKEAGGYLHVSVGKGGRNAPPRVRFVFYDENGVELYAQERTAELK